MPVLTQVLFSFLDAGEDFLEEELVLRLLAVFRNRHQIGQHSRVREAAAHPGIGRSTAGSLDGFMAELICVLLTSPQQLIILDLRKINHASLNPNQ